MGGGTSGRGGERLLWHYVYWHSMERINLKWLSSPIVPRHHPCQDELLIGILSVYHGTPIAIQINKDAKISIKARNVLEQCVMQERSRLTYPIL